METRTLRDLASIYGVISIMIDPSSAAAVKKGDIIFAGHVPGSTRTNGKIGL